MLAKAGYKLKNCPFIIENGRIIKSNETKHNTLDSLDESLLEGKTLFLVIRQLPDWWKSFLWHQSKHTFINTEGNLAKNTGLSYLDSEARNRPGFLFLPKIHAHNTLPDKILAQHYCFESINLIRMEYLIEDFSQYGIELPSMTKLRYSYSPPEKYWTEETIKILYEHNPNWAAIDQKFY